MEEKLVSNIPRVELKDISKIYYSNKISVTALSSVSLKIYPGEIVGIYGPSGAGKSTVLNTIGVAETPTSGSLYFDSKKIDFSNENELIDYRRYFLGYLFQYFNLIPTMTVLENTALPLLLQEVEWKIAHEESKKLLELVGLSHRINHRGFELSGGEMQRVGLARALIHKPKVILADEPTGNLDSKNGKIVLELLRNYLPKESSVVIVSHSKEVLDSCSGLIYIQDGHVV